MPLPTCRRRMVWFGLLLLLCPVGEAFGIVKCFNVAEPFSLKSLCESGRLIISFYNVICYSEVLCHFFFHPVVKAPYTFEDVGLKILLETFCGGFLSAGKESISSRFTSLTKPTTLSPITKVHGKVVIYANVACQMLPS